MPNSAAENYRTATRMQHMAANPTHSVFVSANAGSGKTRVLVERVSRLLLAGAAPDKILCLTYTKAAAAEMQSRLFEALGGWSILSKDGLTDALNKLEDQTRPRSEKELGRARRLFAQALETPGGLKVQTIHGFCEKLLKRFPLEAGIAPGFEALDDRQAAGLLQTIIADIETRALLEPVDGRLRSALSLLAAQKSDTDLDALFGWAMHNTYKITAWKSAGGLVSLAKNLKIPHDLTSDKACAQAWEAAPKAELKTALEDMLRGGVTDVKKARFIEQALTASTPQHAYAHYRNMFFTQKGTPNASMVSKEAGETALRIFGDKKSGYQDEALRMIAAHERVKRAGALELTGAVYALANAVSGKYRALKMQMRLIDFNDQIELARRLLLDADASDWVRYKLDGGVDHVLVDEAQDTSKTQWDIVGAMSDSFFQPAPDTDRKAPRTLFAVGDEKQSIYSFQGARPELFLRKIQNLTEKQQDTPEVKMSMSFRSAQEILNLVDEVFYTQGGIRETFDTTSFPHGSDLGEHVAFRNDPGVIEFWPAVKTPEKPETEIAWQPTPVDTPSLQSPREQLARQIAVQIKKWLDIGECVFERGVGKRPMQARDILILVTKRTGFFDAVIRNLKEQNVPVAGADRLQLTDSIAVQDLLSLAKFTLLPADDLSLAEVLKSPLIGWNEQELFDAASNRKGDLWSNFPNGEARDLLIHLKFLADKYTPYEFFARTLAYVPKAGGESLLQRFYNRLGLEIADGVEAFLAQCLAHQRQGAPSLTRFVSDIENGENIIKREMDAVQNEVRVMTVHGAKGLEAPVVILPDTTQIKTASKEFLYEMVDGGFIASPPSTDRPEMLEAYQVAKQALIDQEAMRLLYVALTRAETRLLICGFESRGKVAENSWHQKIEQALRAMDAQSFETEFGEGLRSGGGLDEYATKEADQTANLQVFDTLPVWARRGVEPDKALKSSIQFLSPSTLVGPEEMTSDDGLSVRSPLWARKQGERPDSPNRFARGIHIHKLLQALPDIDTAKRRSAAKDYLNAQNELKAEGREQIEQEVFAVLEHADFAPFFTHTPDGLFAAEVSLVGGAKELPKHVRFSGQIDRLCVVDEVVWIVDYKSNRPPPKHEGEVAIVYIRQMAAYRALAREIYKGLPVRCALLWTDGPHLMELSDDIMDKVQWDLVLQS